jgi:hypothetical protein
LPENRALEKIVELNSAPKRKERGMPHFTEDTLQRIITNPFYAITVASQLTEEREPPMSEAEWVQANASLMREVGSERWLWQLLDVLGGKVAAPEQPINPSQAVNIDPLFAVEHPPLIGREMWVDVNIMHIRNMGVEEWLRQLLDVLGGDIVTTEEVGFAPPGGTFGYGVPARSHAHRVSSQFFGARKTAHLIEAISSRERGLIAKRKGASRFTSLHAKKRRTANPSLVLQ